MQIKYTPLRQAGTWDPLLQCCLHLDTPLLEQQNTKKLYGAKNNHVHAQLRQILDKRDQEKYPTATFEEPRAKAGYCARPLHTTPPKGWAKHLSHPSGPIPGRTATLTPYKEQAPAPSPQGKASKGACCLFSLPPCCSRGPPKALPDFPVWPLINFY